jgi:hypothetical protein
MTEKAPSEASGGAEWAPDPWFKVGDAVLDEVHLAIMLAGVQSVEIGDAVDAEQDRLA